MVSPIATRVLRRFLVAARPIEIDTGNVARFVEYELVPDIIRWARRQSPDEPIGSASNIARGRITIEEADGRSSVDVDVTIGARPSKAAFAAVLGGRAHERDGRITLELNGAMRARELTPEWAETPAAGYDLTKGRLSPLHTCKHETCLPYGLYSILIHELTHVAEMRYRKPLTYSPSEVIERGEAAWGPYVNDPSEVRAFMQQVVDEVTHNVKHEAIRQHAQAKPNPDQTLVTTALKMSTTWRLIESHLTPSNRAKILKAVYDKLERQGLLIGGRPHIARQITASLATEFEARFERLLAATPNPTPGDIREFRKWISDNFNWSRAPKEAKIAKDRLDHFWRSLEFFENSGIVPGAFARMKGERAWDQEKEMIPAWVRFFSPEGVGKAVTRERTVGSNTYINMVGASDKSLDAMIATIEDAFHSLKGWRKQALAGGVTTVFAGPKDFRGTASGRYNKDHDRLWIRATAGGRIDKAGDGYGSLRYVIVHELGHRYEFKKGLPFDFQRSEWYTSRYSMTEGMSGASEAFAELFAISNFDLKGPWNQATVERFEKVMGGV